MRDNRTTDEVSKVEGFGGTLNRSQEPPCGCIPARFNTECDCTDSCAEDCTDSCAEDCTNSCGRCTEDCTNSCRRCTEDCTIDTIRLIGIRGGSGTSTIAAIMAMHAATMVATELVVADAEHTSALLGFSPPAEVPARIMDNLTLTKKQRIDAGFTVIDGGAIDPSDEPPFRVPGERRIGVLRGPCYLALKTLVAAPQGIHGLIVVSEPGRALDHRDVTDVTRLDVVATVAATPNIARTIDSGLLSRRYRNFAEFRQLRRWLTLQLDPFPTRRPD